MTAPPILDRATLQRLDKAAQLVARDKVKEGKVDTVANYLDQWNYNLKRRDVNGLLFDSGVDYREIAKRAGYDGIKEPYGEWTALHPQAIVNPFEYISKIRRR